MDQLISFLPFLGICVIAASSGAIFAPDTWYRRLRKPSWTPKDWVFPLVWSILFLMIAVAGWQVYLQGGAALALSLYGMQLVFNAAWSGLFFGMKRPDLALVDVALLWLSILATILVFWQILPLAGLLLVPYLLWVSVAAALNFRVWQLNRPFPASA